MRRNRVRDVVDWQLQKADFEPDGSLRDIYVDDATIADWRTVLALILDGNFQARLQRDGVAVPIPTTFESLFDGNDRHLLTFWIAGVELDCHFFDSDEIEFSFAPDAVNEDALRSLLQFMLDISDAIQKRIILTLENASRRKNPEIPIFVYTPNDHDLRWISPAKSR